MAKADYICCDRCDCKIVYDAEDTILDGLKALGFGDAPILCKDCRATPADLSASPAPAVDGWKPIETAPDNGDFLVWLPAHEELGYIAHAELVTAIAGCMEPSNSSGAMADGVSPALWRPIIAPSASPVQAVQGEVLTDASAAECRRILEEITALFEVDDEANEPGTDSHAILWRAREFLKGATPPAGEGREALPDDIRATGWVVAVHNDYRLNGEFHTFWLFTKGDRAVKGEGRSDAEALNAVRDALAAARREG